MQPALRYLTSYLTQQLTDISKYHSRFYQLSLCKKMPKHMHCQKIRQRTVRPPCTRLFQATTKALDSFSWPSETTKNSIASYILNLRAYRQSRIITWTKNCCSVYDLIQNFALHDLLRVENSNLSLCVHVEFQTPTAQLIAPVVCKPLKHVKTTYKNSKIN